jgi:hypothetical protein
MIFKQQKQKKININPIIKRRFIIYRVLLNLDSFTLAAIWGGGIFYYVSLFLVIIFLSLIIMQLVEDLKKNWCIFL